MNFAGNHEDAFWVKPSICEAVLNVLRFLDGISCKLLCLQNIFIRNSFEAEMKPLHVGFFYCRIGKAVHRVCENNVSCWVNTPEIDRLIQYITCGYSEFFMQGSVRKRNNNIWFPLRVIAINTFPKSNKMLNEQWYLLCRGGGCEMSKSNSRQNKS